MLDSAAANRLKALPNAAKSFAKSDVGSDISAENENNPRLTLKFFRFGSGNSSCENLAMAVATLIAVSVWDTILS